MAMTADILDRDISIGRRRRDAPRPFEVEETFWGYVVRARQAMPVLLLAGQVLAWSLGIVLVVAGAGLWVLPATAGAADVLPLRIGASVVFLAFAAILLWFASRGTESELQVDTAQGEVREVVRNRAGKPTLVGRYGFDSIGGVFLERHAGGSKALSGQATLVLRYRNTAQTLPVAIGSETHLAALRDRLGRDLMVRGRAAPMPDRQRAA